VSIVVIDASAGVEIVANTVRGRALARLIPAGSEGWVPEHFYAEVLAVLRRRFLIEAKITAQASAAVRRLSAWHVRRASVAALVPAAWQYRHNMTTADALYVALAQDLGGDLLTDDHRLIEAPTFPTTVNVLRLPVRP
jgi:predicted nucleic acid-binding protein